MQLLLFVATSLSAKPDFCREDVSAVDFDWQGRWGSPSEDDALRALRPSLVRFQDDVCRCTPRRRDWPEMIKARLLVAPNEGEVMVTYHLTPPVSEAGLAMLACLGEPTVSFEPFPFTTDMITEDGRITTFNYTIVADLEDARARKRAERSPP